LAVSFLLSYWRRIDVAELPETQHVDPGFQPGKRADDADWLDFTKYNTGDKQRAFFESFLSTKSRHRAG